MRKLSPDVLAMMSPDATTKAKAREFCRPIEVTAPQPIARLQRREVRYLIPQIPTWHLSLRRSSSRWPELRCRRYTEQGTEAWVGSFRLSVQTSHPTGKKTADLTELAGSVLSRAKVRSRVIYIRKDLNTRRNFVQVAAEHSRACLNDLTWNPATIHQTVPTGSQHLIIGDSLVRDLKYILVVG